MRRILLSLPFLLLTLSPVATAQTVSVPYDFTNGSPADANQVNANFNALESAVNSHDTRITAAQSAVNEASCATAADVVCNPSAVSCPACPSCPAAPAAPACDTLGSFNEGVASVVKTGLEVCANGLTVADHDTGLLWEKKTGTPVNYVDRVICETAGCPDPHDVANAYEWSTADPNGLGVDPDPTGNVFTDFLAKLNDTSQPAAWSSGSSVSIGTQTSGCFADHCNWRLPNIVELQTILDCSFGNPCIDPLFGPTASEPGTAVYWSGSTSATNSSLDSNFAWIVVFNSGGVTTGIAKTDHYFARAVRAGSCEH